MAITLSPETQELVEQRMRQGGFPSPDDLVRAALASLDHRDFGGDPELTSLYPGFREKVEQGLAEAAHGQLADGEAFFAELEREEQDFEEQQQGRKTA